MTMSAPSAITRAALLSLAVAITLALLFAASSTIIPPVTPPAPLTRIVSPGLTSSASDTTCSAVRAGTGNAAASAQEALRGFSATRCAGATSRSAQQPWYGSGTGCVITATPAAGHSTSGPTPTTSPAASTPSAKGGTRPTSQPPVRTNSSQFPTPAALTSISTCPVSNGGGSGSSSSATSAPNASMPAARKLTRGLSRDPDPAGGRPRDKHSGGCASRGSGGFGDGREARALVTLRSAAAFHPLRRRA